MADYTFIEMKEWFYNNAPKIINEKYFLYVMGSIFVGNFYKMAGGIWICRMIRKAEHMSNPKNATLRQIKMKYDSIKEINGHVANPMIFAARSLNKCKLGIFSLNKLNNIINVCIILSVTLAVGTGFGIYLTGKSKIEAIVYVLIGYFFGMVLDMINRSTKISKNRQNLPIFWLIIWKIQLWLEKMAIWKNREMKILYKKSNLKLVLITRNLNQMNKSLTK